MSKVLLYLAWSGFLVSLVAPATQEPFMFFPAWHMPVAVMLAVSALSAFAPLETNLNAILIFAATVCFLASPVVVNAPRRTFRRALSLPVLAGALLAWAPLAASNGHTSHDQLIPLDAPMWGYYLFAVALTLSSVGWLITLFSSVAALDAPRSAEAPPPWSSAADDSSNKRGFLVVVPDKKAEPPRSA